MNNNNYLVLGNNNKKNKLSNIMLIMFYGLTLVFLIVFIFSLHNDKYIFYIKNENADIALGNDYQVELIQKNGETPDYLNYEWQVENSDIATINEYGMITPLKEGITKVKIKSKNSYVIKTMTVNITDVYVTSITFKENNIVLNKNDSYKLETIINGKENFNHTLTYESSNNNIVTVDEYGNVTALNKGSATIKVFINNVSSKCTITVKDNASINLIQSISFNETKINIKKGEKLKLNPIIKPINATNLDLVWKSSNNNVIVDNNGYIIGNKIGQSIITVYSDNDKYATCTINVVENTIEVNSISLNYKNYNLNIGEKVTLITSILPNDATNREINWSSSNTNIASVLDGIVTAKNSGTVTITARTSNGKSASCVITVNKNAIDINKIELNADNIFLKTGNTFNLTASILPSDATNKTITWSSSNTSVASVNNGKVTALKEGTTTITASSGGKSDTCLVTVKSNTFKNPVSSGGDPWIYQKDGYYYYTKTTGMNTIVIYKSTDLTKIESNPKTVFTSSNSQAIWAPEIHYIEGRWYIYYSDATSNNNNTRRIYVLRSKTNDAQGEYEYLGKVSGMPDSHAIDGTIFKWKNEYYFLWSSYKSSSSTQQQIYIAHMSNPYTIDSDKVLISKATYSWEKHGNYINEGPQVLIKNDTLHIIYSASGADTIYYCLGMLTYTGGDLLNASSWKKSSEPVFETSKNNGVYGPGHASFVKSPDGTEDWIIYHAVLNESDAKNWRRTIRIQKFTWNGTKPVFGEPISLNTPIKLPSGTLK